ncbi:leucine-rich repeat domain-containing protein [Mesomycoplasma conjunctivae]|uniref:leucine-rich repeat domain-containing protein n=1 Tax=Mesomycoplasma conjunctivae TaxID=45361 RepID=UPI003DA6548F
MKKIKKLLLPLTLIATPILAVSCGAKNTQAQDLLSNSDLIKINNENRTFTLDLSTTTLKKIDKSAFYNLATRQYFQTANLTDNKESKDTSKTPTSTITTIYYLDSIIFPSTLEEIEDRAFEVDVNVLGSQPGQKIVNLDFSRSTNLKSIGDFAFANNSIRKLILPNSITKIGKNAFANNEIETLEFSEDSKLSFIDTGAFFNNKIIKLDFTNARQIRTINTGAFESNKISAIQFGKDSSPILINNSAFKDNEIKNRDNIKDINPDSRLEDIFE